MKMSSQIKSFSKSEAFFFHVGLTVAKLDEAVEFFVGVFGLELVSERPLHGPYLAHMLGHGRDLTARIAMLKIDESTFLELVEYHSEGASLPSPSTCQKITVSGVPHFAFFVSDLEEFHQRFSDRAIYPLAPTHDVIPRGPLAGGLIRFYRTNFECFIEVIQRPEPVIP